MTTKKFRVWMINNHHNQTTIANAFGLTQVTISTYCTNNRFPAWFEFALKGLEL